jgi:hypothetical protein
MPAFPMNSSACHKFPPLIDGMREAKISPIDPIPSQFTTHPSGWTIDFILPDKQVPTYATPAAKCIPRVPDAGLPGRDIDSFIDARLTEFQMPLPNPMGHGSVLLVRVGCKEESQANSCRCENNARA